MLYLIYLTYFYVLIFYIYNIFICISSVYLVPFVLQYFKYQFMYLYIDAFTYVSIFTYISIFIVYMYLHIFIYLISVHVFIYLLYFYILILINISISLYPFYNRDFNRKNGDFNRKKWEFQQEKQVSTISQNQEDFQICLGERRKLEILSLWTINPHFWVFPRINF